MCRVTPWGGPTIPMVVEKGYMTPRESVQAVLSGKKHERVPWFGDLDYWATALIGRGQKAAGLQAE